MNRKKWYVAIAAALVMAGGTIAGVLFDFSTDALAPIVMASVLVGTVVTTLRAQRSHLRAEQERAASDDPAGVGFAPAWVSSEEHVRKYESQLLAAPLWRRCLGVYEIEPDAPHVELKWTRSPVALFSVGHISVSETGIRYRASEESLADSCGARWGGLDQALEFELPWPSIREIEVVESPAPIALASRLTWLAVRGEDLRGTFNVLLAVRGPGFGAKAMRTGTAALHEAIQTAVPGK